MAVDIEKLFQAVVSKQASDLHLKPATPPIIRLHGQLMPLDDWPVLAEQDVQSIFEELTNQDQQARFAEFPELDLSFQDAQGARFRVNACLQQGKLSLALRRIALEIPSIQDLNLPQICEALALKRSGLILVTGPTGSGKSTTLAAMVDHLNQQEAKRVITVEDPIEYLYQDKLSFITQREIGRDTHAFDIATKHALRQDPDVILVGEMRDLETIAACITAAETGHLVMSTLHTNNAAQTIDRILDSFPPHQQNQIRMQLSLTLEAVLSQVLLPKIDRSGRVPAVELMIATPAVRNLIREGKTHQLISVIQTGSDHGMQTMERALQKLYQDGLISLDSALLHAPDEESLRTSLSSN
jgi:twitching motility protein PilT